MANITLELTAGECAIIMDALHNLELRYSELESLAEQRKADGVVGATGDVLFYRQHGDVTSDTLRKVKRVWRETQGYRY